MNDLGGIIRQLEQQKSAIERALAALREVSGVTGTKPQWNERTSPAKTPRKRRLSPEGRQRIADAARRRWAAKRAAESSSKPSAKKAAKKRQAKQASTATL